MKTRIAIVLICLFLIYTAWRVRPVPPPNTVIEPNVIFWRGQYWEHIRDNHWRPSPFDQDWRPRKEGK